MMGASATVREELGFVLRLQSGRRRLRSRSWSISAGVKPATSNWQSTASARKSRGWNGRQRDDLADNQAYYIGHLPLQLESNEGIAGSLKNIETYNLGLDYLVNYGDTIKSLTRADLQAAAKHYLNPDALVIGVAGPELR